MKKVIIYPLICLSVISNLRAQELESPDYTYSSSFPVVSNSRHQYWRAIQEKARDTVVQIFAQTAELNIFRPFETPSQSESRGTGFFINDAGYLLTNAHVIDQAVAIWVQVPSLGKKLVDAEIVGVYPDRDVALLRITDECISVIKEELGSIPYLTFGDSDKVYRSDEVLALGYPLGQESLKSTSGMISGRQETMIQMSAPINPGSSGGPLLDYNGLVVGINTSGFEKANNVGYIIPINDVATILSDLFNIPLMRRQLFGVTIVKATDSLTEYLGNPQPGGCYIAELVEESPLYKAGARAGDMIYAINGYPVDIYEQMRVPWSEDRISLGQFAARLRRGQTIDFLLYRAGQPLEISATLEDFSLSPIRRIYPGFEMIDYEIFAGMVVMQLTLNHVQHMQKYVPGLAKYAEEQFQNESRLLITHIFPNSLLYKSRIVKPGTLINEINSVPVHTLDDFRHAIRGTENNIFRMNITDTVERNSDKIPVMLPFDKLIVEHVALARTFHFPLSETFKDLYESIMAP